LRYEVEITVSSTIEVTADSKFDAEQAAKDIFSLHTADMVDVEVYEATEIER
jgi:hypothetical protein